MKHLQVKSMRDVRSLLTSAASDRVFDYKWRSAEEIAFYLANLPTDIDGLTTTSFDPVKLKASYTALAALQTKLDVLSGLDVVVSYDFRKDRERLTSSIAEVRASLEMARDKSLRILQRSASKKEPAALKKLVDQTKAFLATRLGGQYASMDDFVYLSPTDTRIDFVHYIHLAKLTNPTNAFTFEDYYFVLSTTDADVLGVTTLHEFKAPGAFHASTTTRPASLQSVVATALSIDGFSVQDRKAIVKDVLKVQAFATPLSSIDLQPGRILATFDCEQKDAVAHARLLLTELTSSLSRYIPGYTFNVRMQKATATKWLAVYKPKASNARVVAASQPSIVLTPEECLVLKQTLLRI